MMMRTRRNEKKTKMMPVGLLVRQKIDDMFLRSDTDKRTDGQKYHNNIALCMYCMLTRDKNATGNTVHC